MEVFKLEKPDLSRISRDYILPLRQNKEKRIEFVKCVFDTVSPKYLYWDKVKYMKRPDELSAEEFWDFIKSLRRTATSRKNSIISHEDGNIFSWDSPVGIEQFLHEFTLNFGGRMAGVSSEGSILDQKIMANSVMEEAIASSQLEGAATTRKVAKKMLQEKTKPKNESEQMILNNYNAMLYLESDLKNKEITIEDLFSLHSILTEKTISPNEIGRLRTDSDNIVVSNTRDETIYHIPPKEQFLNIEIHRLIDYANDKLTDIGFIHPIIKAIVLHFWVGYLHPFTDGNGRLARALFYWYLLKHNYWTIKYIPISRVIKEAPKKYSMAYVYSEQDDYDLTYFLDFNFRKLNQAKTEFEEYYARKEKEKKNLTLYAMHKFNLNERQSELLRYYYKNRNESTTIKIHSYIYNVSRMTAMKDLRELEKSGFVTSKKHGREVRFFATDKIKELFE